MLYEFMKSTYYTFFLSPYTLILGLFVAPPQKGVVIVVKLYG
jgi:hypothetical protein